MYEIWNSLLYYLFLFSVLIFSFSVIKSILKNVLKKYDINIHLSINLFKFFIGAYNIVYIKVFLIGHLLEKFEGRV